MSAETAAVRKEQEDAYAAIPAINWSSLKHIGVSPLMYKHRLEHPEPPKKDFIFGAAVHTRLLEPDKFDERYAVFDGTRDARHEKFKAWMAVHPGVEPLKPAELERVNRAADAVLKHRVAGPLLRGGRREEAVTWTDATTGLACKGRLDYIRPDLIIDLKTSRDPAPAKFERDAHSYGYGGQVAFYHDGAIAARLVDGRERPYLIAVDKKAPHDVAVFQLADEALVAGRLLYRSLLQRLVECTAAGYWPGVAPELQELNLPPWAAGQLLAEEAEDMF